MKPLTLGAKKSHLRVKLEKEVTVLKVINEFMTFGAEHKYYVAGYVVCRRRIAKCHVTISYYNFLH